MNRRTAKLAATFLVGVMAAVIMPLAWISAPVSAASPEEPEEFSLDLVQGSLVLRGAEPHALENPTTLSGTNTGGPLSGIELDTPVVSSRREVPEYGTYADIDAAFSMMEPGVGSINEDGSMSVQLKMAVDLHIVVPLLPEPSDCHTEPINLTLTSTVPYDKDTQQVTLRAANFSVPPVTASAECNGLLVDPINEALAGAGHSLTLTLQGLISPPPEGDPTTTTLAVSPAGSAGFGDDVTMTATVVPNGTFPENGPIAGVVTFLDDGEPIGTAEVADDGTATLTTSELPAGPRQLSADYGGAPPDWDPSKSGVAAYTVTADPLVSTTAAGEVRVGGTKDFSVTVDNTEFGADLDDARLEVKINRQVGNGPIGPNGDTPRITLARVVDGTATDVELAYAAFPAPASLNGTVGDADTWLLDAGEAHTETLRLGVASGVAVGPLTVTFTLVRGEGDERDVLSSSSGVITMVNEARSNVTIESGTNGFPVGCTTNCIIQGAPPLTPTVRQGNTAELRNLRVTGTTSGVPATGTFTATIDGVPLPIQHASTVMPNPYVWTASAPVGASGTSYLLKLPPTVTTGTHQVTVRYSGDGLYAPAQRTWSLTVENAIGTVYECVGVFIGSEASRFTANVEVQATLPPVWAAGQELPVDRVQVKMRASRTITNTNAGSSVVSAPPDERNWTLNLGPDGAIEAASFTRSNFTAPVNNDPNPPDMVFDFTGGTGVLDINATPGTATTYTLDEIDLTATAGGTPSGFKCTPVTDPYVIGTVVSAGTTLAVEPAVPAIAAGEDVTLAATAHPAAPGWMHFRDGDSTIGVVPVPASGVATLTTDDLGSGPRQLTAQFYGGPVATSRSAIAPLVVVGDCSTITPVEVGNGAAVRLVYMELLRRCPDAGGYGYWKDQLDTETVTREQFATQISSSKEARKVIVADAYQLMLERPASPADLEYWAGQLAGNAGYHDLLAAIATAGDEYSNLAGGTVEGYVTRTYEQILGFTPSAADREFWVDYIDRHGKNGKKQLILGFFGLPGPRGAIVRAAYQEILDRDPTADELEAGIALFGEDKDRSRLYASLIGLDEFFDRAQEFPELD